MGLLARPMTVAGCTCLWAVRVEVQRICLGCLVGKVMERVGSGGLGVRAHDMAWAMGTGHSLVGEVYSACSVFDWNLKKREDQMVLRLVAMKKEQRVEHLAEMTKVWKTMRV